MSETGTILYSLQSNYWNDRMIGRKGCRKGGKEKKMGSAFTTVNYRKVTSFLMKELT